MSGYVWIVILRKWWQFYGRTRLKTVWWFRQCFTNVSIQSFVLNVLYGIQPIFQHHWRPGMTPFMSWSLEMIVTSFNRAVYLHKSYRNCFGNMKMILPCCSGLKTLQIPNTLCLTNKLTLQNLHHVIWSSSKT